MSQLNEDSLWIPESNDRRRHAREARNLEDYDKALSISCRAPSAIDNTGDGVSAYLGTLLLNEMRVPLNGEHVPVLLSMAAGYIYARLCDISGELIKAAIPYRYRPARHHGCIEGKYRRWDMRLHANGHEGALELLRKRVWAYERERLDSLLTRWDAGSRSRIYVVQEQHARTRLHIIFSNKECLRQVRLRCFTDDCHNMMGSSEELETEVTKEKYLLARYIEMQLKDIRDNQPNMTPVGRRHRIMVR